MYVLPVADLNSQAIESILDNILYYIVLDWNETGGYWGIAIRNSAYRTLIDGISLVPNWPLTKQFRYADMPPGELIVNTKYRSGPIPRNGFSSGVYELVYMTQQDLIDNGLLDVLGRTSASAI